MGISENSSCLIVEPSSGVGNEFIACMNSGESWGQSPLEDHALDLISDMTSRNLLTSDGRVHLPGLHPLLCERIHRHKLNVLFLTDIVKVEKLQCEYEVTLHNVAGFNKIRVKRIIDTTSTCLSRTDWKVPIISKRINAYVDCLEQAAQPPDLSRHPDVEIHQGRFDTEFIFKLSISPDDDWPSARRKLNEYWENRPEILQSWRLTTIASAFEFKQESLEWSSDNWFWRPSNAFVNPVLAFNSHVNSFVRREGLQ
ncbi:hypothetical protein [Paenibacillus sp. GXUN7292]|uniref:hypothetical protein n=1 Tax=Paenibacillus sp. GXUN7292 TaxID=3422499 RepID=UPI003D7EC8F1